MTAGGTHGTRDVRFGITRRLVAVLGVLLGMSCGGEPETAKGVRIAEVQTEAAADRAGGVPARTDAAGLARAAGGADGTRYTVRQIASPGVLIGRIGGGSPRDTSIAPTHDLAVCRPFTESSVASRNGGVGSAVVWLEGVAEGPRDDSPRRARLTLDGCRLEPRVQRIALGATLIVHGRDAMMSRLQFVPAGETGTRGTVLLSDAGQVVPTDEVARTPGLVHVRDDLHPWVRAWVVVAPHPFVAVTDADGAFRFDGVPPGRYALVVWHERLGVRRTNVRVDASVQTNVTVNF